MTTAARPTFDPAKGGSGRGEKDLSAISRQYSSRDLPGHLKLKYRQPGQGTVDEVRTKDLYRELEDREKRPHSPSDTLATDSESKRLAIESVAQVPANWDADDPTIGRDSDDDCDTGNARDDSDNDSDNVDEEMELLKAELEHIQKERAIIEAKKEAERKEEEEKIRMENLFSGNPLLTKYAAATSASSKDEQPKVKRRWDDDVVFKNCAKSEPSKKSNTFINDSLRSEFHKKFMSKYIK